MCDLRRLLRDEVRGSFHIVSVIEHSDAVVGPAFVGPDCNAITRRAAPGLSFRFEHPAKGPGLRTRTLRFENLARDLQNTRTRLLGLQACRLPSIAAAGLLEAVEHIVGFSVVVSPSTTREFAQPFFAALATPTSVGGTDQRCRRRTALSTPWASADSRSRAGTNRAS